MDENNTLHLHGTVTVPLTEDHRTHGELFYRTMLEVPRLSDTSDLLPVMISEGLITDIMPQVGDILSVDGQIRTYNTADESGKTHLTVVAFAHQITEAADGQNPNTVSLQGTICKKPTYRHTPLGREIADLMVAVNRPYGKSCYIPCIAWGRRARFLENAPIGTKISLTGRFQSREYQKMTDTGETETRRAYEVSIIQLNVED